MVALLRTLRPHQWVKNAFVLAPLVFAKHLFDREYAIRAGLATLCFCLLSGAVYAFNDVKDVEADRLHPTKRHRPIAAGALSESAALTAAAVLAIVALGGAALLSIDLALVCGAYLVQNLLYTLRLKQVAFVDVMLIASGFLLRVYAGAVAIDVPPSPYLLWCTVLLATFLGLGKRAHEMAWAEKAGKGIADTRAALAGYSPRVVRALMLVLAVATCVAYVLYTQDAHTVGFFGTHQLVWSTPFAVIGIFRFVQLALWQPREDSPTEAMIRDPIFLLNLVAWGGVVVYIVYVAK
ncbi:MAG TPA: decaprenyl-phosphate phosphoribosyltransferase [Kofleriaceae bacterium]|jgi:4-hydroxybenzoate polyprenyltransferase|nr:decaprenyl-phosphate phosphoribosyltransferase [Kofleriaceae bacterium]